VYHPENWHVESNYTISPVFCPNQRSKTLETFGAYSYIFRQIVTNYWIKQFGSKCDTYEHTLWCWARISSRTLTILSIFVTPSVLSGTFRESTSKSGYDHFRSEVYKFIISLSFKCNTQFPLSHY
jgi:hypothetical protein